MVIDYQIIGYNRSNTNHNQTHNVFEINKGGIGMKILTILILVTFLVL